MVFSSMTFLWLFLPLVFVLSLIIRRPRLQNYLLLIFSLLFYAWGEPVYLFLMLFSILMNWTFGLLIEKSAAHKKLFLVLDIIGNLGLLGYFKYTNFILDTIRRLLPSASVPVTHIALPIGISFFTFQAMSYVIDLYRGRYRAQKNLFHLALYISFFPQLIAGPIVQYKDIEDQIMNRKRTPEKIASGIRRFIYGLGKKVIISNLVASSVDKLFALSPENMTGVMAWTAAILYTLQIYYDFSGWATRIWRSASDGCSASSSLKTSTIPIFQSRSASSGGAGTFRFPRGSATMSISRSAATEKAKFGPISTTSLFSS